MEWFHEVMIQFSIHILYKHNNRLRRGFNTSDLVSEWGLIADCNVGCFGPCKGHLVHANK